MISVHIYVYREIPHCNWQPQYHTVCLTLKLHCYIVWCWRPETLHSMFNWERSLLHPPKLNMMKSIVVRLWYMNIWSMLFTSFKWRQFSMPLLSLQQEMKSNAQYGLCSMCLNWLYTGRIVNFISSENPLWVKLCLFFFIFVWIPLWKLCFKTTRPCGHVENDLCWFKRWAQRGSVRTVFKSHTQKTACPCASAVRNVVPPHNSELLGILQAANSLSTQLRHDFVPKKSGLSASEGFIFCVCCYMLSL